MRFALALLAVGAFTVGCAQLPLPVGSGIPASCAERLTESACREGTRCRWISDFKRTDGTYATAHCSAE